MGTKKKKYDWKIGHPLPFLDEHSQTKHDLVAEYIKRYVEVYFRKAQVETLPISIVDGFAGGGRYRNRLTDDISDGSPFLIFESIKEAAIRANVDRKKPRRVNADYYFVEKLEPHIDFLENEIKHSSYRSGLGSNIFLVNEAFEDAAKDIVARIKARNRAQRAIFILDQYAYKDVPLPLVRKILTTLKNSEVILTFNFDALQSYLTDSERHRSALQRIGLDKYIDWQRIAYLKEGGAWKKAIQEQLANAIFGASGAKHMTLFFVTPKKGWTYWLVHLSKVYKARDVMMELHWKYSNSSSLGFEHFLNEGIFSLGYQSIETPGQGSFAFDSTFDFSAESEKRCISSLSRDIPRLLCDFRKEVTFSELTDQIGSNTPASEKQIRGAIQESLSRKDIIVESEDRGLRKAASRIVGTDRISYRQDSLIFL